MNILPFTKKYNSILTINPNKNRNSGGQAMITTKKLTSIDDFKGINKGDTLAVQWKLDTRKGKKRTRFAAYEVYDNLTVSRGLPEIVLQKSYNVYFNYEMFLNGESNAKDVVLIYVQSEDKP